MKKSAILQNYHDLVENLWGKFNGSIFFRATVKKLDRLLENLPRELAASDPPLEKIVLSLPELGSLRRLARQTYLEMIGLCRQRLAGRGRDVAGLKPGEILAMISLSDPDLAGLIGQWSDFWRLDL